MDKEKLDDLLTEVCKNKRVAEKKISAFTLRVLEELEQKTGFTPSKISFVFLDVTQIDHKKRRRIVSDVNIELICLDEFKHFD